ncbi:VIT1/CCC1 transporter family protein [Canibacter sp. lx-45]|uniref:VIT1/CCC1 transporter family protein n=1 Tax=Canibacter zhuwentaonis TaxID=2837491 RepID=UPI001BDBDC15|nr:VIT1/CCC1 transporter family protein [Canibacter zhuwentaonis]MBT1035481.1 VIT1/CCC1 transporter family protein [Canibacter zhuwentaonis]
MIAIDPSSPHKYDHVHANVNSGWLRAAVFGAMDGLVSNIGLITGIAAAGANPAIILATGVSGLCAGALSMALGEYTSVKSANEQLDSEIAVETAALARNPRGEQLELAREFTNLGMTPATAAQAAYEVHQNPSAALKIHLSTEMGLSVDKHPSPWTAALSSIAAFSTGAIIPLIPYIIGLKTLFWALGFGAAGLLLTGGVAAYFTRKNFIRGALRQLVLGGIAVGATYFIGNLFGISEMG